MLTGLIAPFLPYILGVAGLLGAAAVVYVKWLISQRKSLQAALALAKTANEQNVKTIETMIKQHEAYVVKMEQLNKQSIVQAAAKNEALKEAEKIVGSDGDAITQEDLDKLAAAKKNRGKK